MTAGLLVASTRPSREDDRVQIAAAVIAAGSGRRMGGPKAELVLSGRRLVDRAVTHCRDSGLSPVIAVVPNGVTVPEATTLVNPAPEHGMRSSLQIAVGAAPEVDALAVMLVDTPGIEATAIAAVVAQWRPGRVTIGSYAGRTSHPIVMAPAQWHDALAMAGPDEGARRYLAAHPDLIDPVPVAGDPQDLDTPEDLESWRASQRR